MFRVTRRNGFELFLLLSLVLSVVWCMSPTMARDIRGTVNITVNWPSESIIVFCTSKEKYPVEPGGTQNITLRIRNPMVNKTLRHVHVLPVMDSRLEAVFSPASIDAIPPGERGFFYVNITVPEDMDLGNYKVEFLLGTDEYTVGTYRDAVMIRVTKHTQAKFYLMFAVVILVVMVLIIRFFWIRKINTKKKREHRPGRKLVSHYYYKK